MTRDVASLVARAIEGDRGSIAKLISIVESGGPDSDAAGAALYPHTGGAYTVGLTGAPGAGKSSLTDALVGRIRADQLEVGVLAIDPTSPFSGGAILGDRVRMQDHATDAGVYIRSMATRGHLGGLALATPRAARVLDAAGKPWILVETVGVGQVEVEIAGAADTTVVVVNPGWGDGVQANKAGLMEIADVFVVNKADRDGVERVLAEIQSMLSLAPDPHDVPEIVKTSALQDEGTEALLEAVHAFRRKAEERGALALRRRSQARRRLEDAVRERLAERVRREVLTAAETERAVEKLVARELDPHTVAETILARAGLA
jgi:LAO/AO transport system kinase